jgi:hypothetical protein
MPAVGEFLGGGKVHRVVDGVAVSFERRRYPGTTFTWAHAFIGGEWISLGDPWPCLNPKTTELRREIAIRQPGAAHENIAN